MQEEHMPQEGTTATRHAVWKGAMGFGLVHVPASLHPVSAEAGVDFDWLDAHPPELPWSPS